MIDWQLVRAGPFLSPSDWDRLQPTHDFEFDKWKKNDGWINRETFYFWQKHFRTQKKPVRCTKLSLCQTQTRGGSEVQCTPLFSMHMCMSVCLHKDQFEFSTIRGRTFWFRLGLGTKVRIRLLLGLCTWLCFRVSSSKMNNVNECPHKDTYSHLCVCVCVCTGNWCSGSQCHVSAICLPWKQRERNLIPQSKQGDIWTCLFLYPPPSPSFSSLSSSLNPPLSFTSFLPLLPAFLTSLSSLFILSSLHSLCHSLGAINHGCCDGGWAVGGHADGRWLFIAGGLASPWQPQRAGSDTSSRVERDSSGQGTLTHERVRKIKGRGREASSPWLLKCICFDFLLYLLLVV